MALPRSPKAGERLRGKTNGAAGDERPAEPVVLDRTKQAFTVDARRVVRDDTADAEDTARVARFPTGSVVLLVLFGLMSFGLGWYFAFNGVIPGLFRAADMGVPITLLMLLRTTSRIFTEGIRHHVLSSATAAIPKAAAWAMGVYWALSTWTNVFQLAVGLALGIMIYQLYAVSSRLSRAGFRGFGPGLPVTVMVLGGYAVWRLARLVLGPAPGFDLLSLLFTALLVVLVLVRARRLTRAADRRVPVEEVATAARTGQGIGTRRMATTLAIGYLVFHFLVSPVIPYGPIVEWFLVCIGVLFFAVIAADRIGTVPTRRALPRPEARTHVQKVLRIPDRRLEETQAHVEAFVQQGADAAWVEAYFRELLADDRLEPEEVARHLAPFHAVPARRRAVAPVETMSREARERLVHDLLVTVRENRRPRHDPTGSLKSGRPVDSTRGRRTAPS